MIVLVVAVLLTRMPWFGNPVAGIDEQLYSLIGWRMTQGDLPYVDLWDRKPFGLFAIFGLAHAIGGPGPLSYQLLACLFALAGALAVYRLARELAGPTTSLLSAITFCIFLSLYKAQSGQAEAFFVPVMTCAFMLVAIPANMRTYLRRALLAMALCGLALQIKYTALPQCIFFGLLALWRLHRQGMGLPALAGWALVFNVLGLLPTGLAWASYAAAGHGEAFAFANFISFFDRLPSGAGRIPDKDWLVLIPLGGVAGFGLLVSILTNPTENPAMYRLYVLYGLSCLAVVMLPATTYFYYYAAFAPAVALIAVPAIDRLAPLPFPPGLIIVGALLYLLGPVESWRKAQVDEARTQAFAAQIAPLLADGRCLYIYDGPTVLYRLTQSCLPSRFIYPDHLHNALETPSLGVNQADAVRAVLDANPAVIVTASDPYTPHNPKVAALVEARLAARYERVKAVTISRREVTAWKLIQ